MTGFGSYFQSRREAREWMAFDEADRENASEATVKYYQDFDRYEEWKAWRECFKGLSETEWREIAEAAFQRWLSKELPVDLDIQDALSDELDERAAKLVLGPLPQ